MEHARQMSRLETQRSAKEAATAAKKTAWKETDVFKTTRIKFWLRQAAHFRRCASRSLLLFYLRRKRCSGFDPVDFV